jgi:hypothetical protein
MIITDVIEMVELEIPEKCTKWALNTHKGSTINHPSVGKLIGGVAYAVTEKEAQQLKHVMNIVVFDNIDGIKDGSDNS